MNEMGEELVEIGVGPRPSRHRYAAIVEDPAIGGEPVTLRVAQDLAPVELVEGKGALTARQPHRAGTKQLLQLLNDAEDADLFVLIDVIDIADRDDPLRGDRLVIRLDTRRDSRLAKILG